MERNGFPWEFHFQTHSWVSVRLGDGNSYFLHMTNTRAPDRRAHDENRQRQAEMATDGYSKCDTSNVMELTFYMD